MPDRDQLIRIETKVDAVILGQNQIFEKIGNHSGRLDGYKSQVGWLWGLVTGSIMLAVGALIRSIT